MAKVVFRSATVAMQAAVRAACCALLGDVGNLFPAEAIVRLNTGIYAVREDGSGKAEAYGIRLEIRRLSAYDKYAVAVSGANYAAVALLANLLGGNPPRKVAEPSATKTANTAEAATETAEAEKTASANTAADVIKP